MLAQAGNTGWGNHYFEDFGIGSHTKTSTGNGRNLLQNVKLVSHLFISGMIGSEMVSLQFQQSL
jgi:hypothetical protein